MSTLFHCDICNHAANISGTLLLFGQHMVSLGFFLPKNVLFDYSLIETSFSKWT